MQTHRRNRPDSHTEEWLNLETSLALLGQKIADKMLIYYQEKGKTNPDTDLLNQLKADVLELGRARQACYRRPAS